MASRLLRFRQRNGIKPETIARLCGFSVDDLQQFETGGQVPEADRLALLILFNDELTLGDILGNHISDDDDVTLRRMDCAFRTTCIRWSHANLCVNAATETCDIIYRHNIR